MKLIASTAIVATLLLDLVVGESLLGTDTSIGDEASRVQKVIIADEDRCCIALI